MTMAKKAEKSSAVEVMSDYSPAPFGEVSEQTGAGGGMVDVAQSRAAQEVQAAMVVAKRFPRDEARAFGRIMQSCHRKGLAEAAIYAYPRGNETVSGPSIRLAEAMAQAWGNLDFGIIEIEQDAKKKESVVMAYCWDLETNTRQTKVFTVPHVRYSKKYGNKPLTDPRDIYEMTANQGARRLRACILGIIPGDVQDAAIVECDKTLAGQTNQPLSDRARLMAVSFGELGVTQAMIEARLRHPIAEITESELLTMRKVYTTIKDNVAAVGDFFPSRVDAEMPDAPNTDKLFAKLSGPKKEAEKVDTATGEVSDPVTPDKDVTEYCPQCGRVQPMVQFTDGSVQCQECSETYSEAPAQPEPSDE
jgi:hypothetical protein